MGQRTDRVGSVLPLLGSVINLGEKCLHQKFMLELFGVAVSEADSHSSLAGNSAFLLFQHPGMTGVSADCACCLPFKCTF